MGGGSKTTTTSKSEQGSGQQWANPYAIDAAREALGVYNANAPYLDQQAQKARDLVGTFEGNLTKAGSVGNAGQGYFNSVMGGKYLTGNPYIDAMIDQTNRSVTDQVASQFTAAGRYGSDYHTDTLGRALADAQNQLRYGDYSSERDRMGQAAQGSVAADAARAQAEAAAAQTLLAQQALAAEMPYTGTNSLASSLNALFSGGTSDSKTVQKSGGGLLNGIGTALGGAGALAKAGGFAAISDRRAKADIVKVGEEPDGLGVYAFRYKNGSVRQLGTMSDEVARLRPWALGPVVDGYQTVNYPDLDKAA